MDERSPQSPPEVQRYHSVLEFTIPNPHVAVLYLIRYGVLVSRT
jgi:hypothetical protein